MREARAFVVGWPIAHSRSPMIHRSWLAAHGLGGSYEAVAVPPEGFADFVGGLRANGFAGGNVTIPHKEAAFRLVDAHDRAAAAIGAVNTVWFEGDRLVGGNTDAYGFAANLDDRLAGWRSAQTALVLGAGGAARAVVHALREAGIGTVHVVNRNEARARQLAEAFGHGVVGSGPQSEVPLLGEADLLVNTRPTGGTGGLAVPVSDLSHVRQDALATDIVYVPLQTPFLEAAAERGLRTADGLGMLLHQAVPGFERWFGVRPAVQSALREAIQRDILAAS